MASVNTIVSRLNLSSSDFARMRRKGIWKAVRKSNVQYTIKQDIAIPEELMDLVQRARVGIW